MTDVENTRYGGLRNSLCVGLVSTGGLGFVLIQPNQLMQCINNNNRHRHKMTANVRSLYVSAHL